MTDGFMGATVAVAEPAGTAVTFVPEPNSESNKVPLSETTISDACERHTYDGIVQEYACVGAVHVGHRPVPLCRRPRQRWCTLHRDF